MVALSPLDLHEYARTLRLPVLDTEALDTATITAADGIAPAFLENSALLPLVQQDNRYRVASGIPLQASAVDAFEREFATTVGASVVAVIRDTTSIPGPGPDLCFEPGDVVLVMGSVASVLAATRRLTA